MSTTNFMKRILGAHTYIYLALILVTLLFVIAHEVRAHEGHPEHDAPTTIAQEDTTPRETMEARREAVAEMREERRAALMENMQDRIINLAANVINRLAAATDRMYNIIARLDSRIEKLDENGVDTKAAQEKLTAAKSELEKADEALTDLESVSDAVRGDTPKEAFATVRAEFIAVRESLKLTHTYLRDTVALLKDAVRAAELGQGVSPAVTDTERPQTTEVSE